MWGFYNSRNRDLANILFKSILNSNISSKYNLNYTSPKGYDQYFLSTYVYPEISRNSIIHDSYFCLTINDSKPFPTKRNGDCFVGTLEHSCNDKNPKFEPCPIQCRPKNHLDWTFC